MKFSYLLSIALAAFPIIGKAATPAETASIDLESTPVWTGQIRYVHITDGDWLDHHPFEYVRSYIAYDLTDKTEPLVCFVEINFINGDDERHDKPLVSPDGDEIWVRTRWVRTVDEFEVKLAQNNCQWTEE